MLEAHQPLHVRGSILTGDGNMTCRNIRVDMFKPYIKILLVFFGDTRLIQVEDVGDVRLLQRTDSQRNLRCRGSKKNRQVPAQTERDGI